jgi:hypothetical protein
MIKLHAFTIEQVRKFIDAIGGKPMPARLDVDNHFSTEELRELAKSSGGLKDYPKITERSEGELRCRLRCFL